MNGFSKDELDWAAKTAGQLRLIQADCADVEPAERQTYLEEEIQRALRGIGPEQRPSYLRALGGRFPTGEAGSAAAKKPEPEKRSESSAEALVHQLISVARKLSVREVQELGVKLQQAGFLPATPTAMADQPPEEFEQRFPLTSGHGVDSERHYKLTATLADFVFGMEKVVWNIWKAIAPKSRIRRDVSPQGDLRQMGGKYLSGDREVSLAQLSQIIDKQRQLLAGILTAIGPAGGTFAKHHLARFSPEAIKDLASAESGLFLGIEQKCWRKYVELASEFSEDSVETEFQEAIARYAEDLIRGAGRSSEN